MANVFYGDGGFTAVTGNWNTVANWFSTTGSCCCGSETPGTPLGRVPNPATDTVILTKGVSGDITLTTGPTGGYSGAIKTGSGGLTSFNFAAGIFSGVIDWTATAGGPFGVQLTISGGTFSGSFPKPADKENIITGGTYSPPTTATQTGGVLNYPSASIKDPGFQYGGGTYAPVITITNFPDILGAGLPT
jgi:hypothetical protein